MVNFYCRACGLYISVPADFAGGKGVCPRCKTSLRIPRPLPADHPDSVEGLRYVAEPANAPPLPPTEHPPIITRELGPSSRFACSQCGQEFESLRAAGRSQGQCPNCGHVNETPTLLNVAFPRELFTKNTKITNTTNATNATSPAAAGQQGQGPWDMDGEFLLAQRSADQSPSDSIIQGLPFQSNKIDAPGSALYGAEKSTPDIEAELAAAIDATETETPPAEDSDDKDNVEWFYLLQDQQHGPVSSRQLKELVIRGKVSPSALVFHEGLKGWRPIEEFGELRIEALDANESETAPESPMVTIQDTKQFHNRLTILPWLFVAAICVLVLCTVMKQSFFAVGQAFFVRANLALALLMFLGSVYGGVLIGRHWRQFARAPRLVRLRGLVGMTGLLGCLLITLVLAFSWRSEGNVKLDRNNIFEAQRVFQVLRRGNMKSFSVAVDWENLTVNGQEYGEKFRQSRSQGERQKLMEEVCNLFLTAFEPHYRQEDLDPVTLKGWQVVARCEGDTVVAVRIASTGRTLRFTLRANRLIALETK